MTFGPFTLFAAKADDEVGDIYVLRCCPICNRFLKTGKLSVNRLCDVKLEGWVCKKHGEVKPLIEFN